MTCSIADPRKLKTSDFGVDFSDFDGFVFTGKQWDEDAELYYFNARWYDPETGRFITEDPVKDGLLWFAYVNNNPMGFVDPTGNYPVRMTDNYRMQDTRWALNEDGSRTELFGSNGQWFMDTHGCRQTSEARTVTAMTGESVYPSDLNTPQYNDAEGFYLDRVNSNYGLIGDYWTSKVQGDLGNKMMELFSDPIKGYTIRGRLSVKEGGDAEHWVDIENVTQIEGLDGFFAEILPTSNNDAKYNIQEGDFVSRPNDGSWIFDQLQGPLEEGQVILNDGKYYVNTTVFDKIETTNSPKRDTEIQRHRDAQRSKPQQDSEKSGFFRNLFSRGSNDE